MKTCPHIAFFVGMGGCSINKNLDMGSQPNPDFTSNGAFQTRF